jgi:hypothetical protein
MMELPPERVHIVFHGCRHEFSRQPFAHVHSSLTSFSQSLSMSGVFARSVPAQLNPRSELRVVRRGSAERVGQNAAAIFGAPQRPANPASARLVPAERTAQKFCK